MSFPGIPEGGLLGYRTTSWIVDRGGGDAAPPALAAGKQAAVVLRWMELPAKSGVPCRPDQAQLSKLPACCASVLKFSEVHRLVARAPRSQAGRSEGGSKRKRYFDLVPIYAKPF